MSHKPLQYTPQSILHFMIFNFPPLEHPQLKDGPVEDNNNPSKYSVILFQMLPLKTALLERETCLSKYL